LTFPKNMINNLISKGDDIKYWYKGNYEGNGGTLNGSCMKTLIVIWLIFYEF
jgi:hypothetical protein